MTALKIKLKLNSDNPVHMKALSNLMNELLVQELSEPKPTPVNHKWIGGAIGPNGVIILDNRKLLHIGYLE